MENKNTMRQAIEAGTDYTVDTSVEQKGDQVLGKVKLLNGDREAASAGFRFDEPRGNLIIGPARHMFRVNPAYSGRGLGLGVKVGKEAIRLAKQTVPIEKVDKVSLTTKRTNAAMMTTAARLGFHMSGQDENNAYYTMNPEEFATHE